MAVIVGQFDLIWRKVPGDIGSIVLAWNDAKGDHGLVSAVLCSYVMLLWFAFRGLQWRGGFG